MQDDGFHVRLESLAQFQKTLDDTLRAYGAMIAQLKAADPTMTPSGIEDLLGGHNLAGSNRVHEACRTMIGNYATLYRRIAQANDLVVAQLGIAANALAETRNSYAQHETRREKAFHELMSDLPSRARGGDRGTSGQE